MIKERSKERQIMIEEGPKDRQIMQFVTEHIIIMYKVVTRLPPNYTYTILLTVHGCYTLSVLTYPLLYPMQPTY